WSSICVTTSAASASVLRASISSAWATASSQPTTARGSASLISSSATKRGSCSSRSRRGAPARWSHLCRRCRPRSADGCARWPPPGSSRLPSGRARASCASTSSASRSIATAGSCGWTTSRRRS
ncbi:MAG: hypothetical protein AVDCRST_MAG67-823, partial [uncultured Solirubrobacteraceae bacterium]